MNTGRTTGKTAKIGWNSWNTGNTAVRENGARPTGWRPGVLGAAVVAALLASTACASGASGATQASVGAESPARPVATSPTRPDATPSGRPGGGTAAVPACTQESLGVSAVREPADAEDARHLLITVQNSGDEKCALYRYPHVRLGADARTTVPVIEESDPDPGVPVVIAPGREAYAALLVSGGARDEYEARSITLTLQGRADGSHAGAPIDVPMPVDTLYADDGQLVTYWTTASGFALDFIMSK
ncbi:DUF4232 domain-containing protein [Streptomyces sp. bgisy154]|uniref:DUF4232 domain-containing protein n=1 Tax=Streptomyces sp. bgisy154 TaxID=3413794 RepID=UPI003D757BEB